MHWMETDASGGGVPHALTEAFGPHQVVMRGTWETQPRCIALDADIGTSSRCLIHAVRPQACRDVRASWEDGSASLQCDKARAAHGLTALTPADWVTSTIGLLLVDTIDASQPVSALATIPAATLHP